MSQKGQRKRMRCPLLIRRGCDEVSAIHLCLAITKNGPFLPREPTHKTGQAVLSRKSSRIL
jgi:hypothetical protein